MHLPKRRGGFTLLESIAAIAIGGTVSAVAVPMYLDVMRSARVAKMDMARSAVNTSAQVYHTKWMLAGSPSAPTVLENVALNEAGYPTSAGILVAAGLADTYDTRVAGIIAVDPQHPNCRLVYAPATGSTVVDYADGANC